MARNQSPPAKPKVCIVNRSKRSLNLSGYRHKWPFCALWESKPLITDPYNPMWYVLKFHSCPLKAFCDGRIVRCTFRRLSHIPANVKLWGSPRQSRGFTPINYSYRYCLCFYLAAFFSASRSPADPLLLTFFSRMIWTGVTASP